MRIFKPLLLALLVLTAAVQPLWAQNPDPASGNAVKPSIAPVIHINAAHTGTTVDRSGYFGAWYFVAIGHSVDASGSKVYVVLQDSAAADVSWNNIDSVLTDTVDNASYVGKSYTGAKRYLRLLARAASANDTSFLAGLIVLTSKRLKT